MPVTPWIILSCTVGISLAKCFCICIFFYCGLSIMIFWAYIRMIFFLVVNNELCFSFFATGLTKHARQVLDHRAVSQAHCYQILSQHRLTLHILSSNALSACDKIRGRLIFFLLNSPLSFLSPDFLGSCRQLDSSGKCREFICL